MSVSAFFCETPYHVLNSINIKWHLLSGEECDIFIRNLFNDAEDLAQRLKQSGLFRHVFLINLPHDRKIGKVRNRFYKFLYPHLIRQYIPSPLVDSLYYDKIVAFNECIMAWNFFEYFRRKNRNIKLYFAEEGILSYYVNLDDSSSKRRWLWKHFHIRLFSTGRVNGTFLYDPNIATFTPTSPLLQLPKMDPSEVDFVEQVNKIFDFNQDAVTLFANKKYIYLDQPVLETGDIHSDNGLEFLEHFCEYVDRSEILVKLHPRREESFYDTYGYSTVFQSRYPFELLVLNCPMDQKILISEMSSALLTPKIIFGEEPKVLLTYDIETRAKLVFQQSFFHTVQEPVQQLFHNVQQTYTDKKRFCIPSTWEDVGNFMQGDNQP